MRNIIINSMIAWGIALVVSSCSTGQMAVNSASNDDVYNSNIEAKTITYAARTFNDYSDSGENGDTRNYEGEAYDSRLSIDNRNPYSWRDHYYNNYLPYDPFYIDPFYNNWYSPGFSVGLGWNSWGGNSWSLGWNNWGWNSFGYNPWYSPYHSPFWGPYSYYGYGYGRPYYGGYWGGGYYGGGYWGGGYWGGVISRNPGVARPDRGGRVSTTRPGVQSSGSRSSVSRIPRPSANTRPSATTRPSTGSTDRSSVGAPSSTRPSRSGTTQERPTRTESQRPSRTERPSIERSSPQPSYTPSRPSSGGGRSSSGGGGSSSGGGGRPSR